MSLSITGIGVAGTPDGGVLTVQGDPSGTPIPVTFSPSPSVVTGVYTAGGAQQPYTVSALQRVASLLNPSGSGKIIRVKFFMPDVTPAVTSAVATLSLQRTSDTPSGGTLETTVALDSAYPAGVGVMRSSPTTATATGGRLWRMTMPFFAQLGAYPPNTMFKNNEIVLRAGEAIVYSGTVQNCSIGACFLWTEEDE